MGHMNTNEHKRRETDSRRAVPGKRPMPPDSPPELYQVVIECRDETQQREWFERLKREGMKVRLLVL
jgi:hypothetical protein